MAILWEKHIQGTCYQVRTHGASRRLYSNGVFHSQYNDKSPVSGTVWDLLLLPSYLMPHTQVRRILLLGVGGGAVIKQLQYFYPGATIDGVELNRTHLSIAKRFFKVRGKGITLHHAEASTWLANYRGEPFDLIIDDLFGHSEGEPVRAIAVDPSWCDALTRHLHAKGSLVINFDTQAAFRRSAIMAAKRYQFVQGYRLTTPGYENQIGAFVRCATNLQTLTKRLQSHPLLDTRKAQCRLRFTIKPVRLMA